MTNLDTKAMTNAAQPINESPSMGPGPRTGDRAWAALERLTAALGLPTCTLWLVLRESRPSCARREPHLHEATKVTAEKKNCLPKQFIWLGRGYFLVHFYEEEKAKYKAMRGPLNLDLPL